jgi:predicted nuclease of predicted toxin-antitoxin system
MRLLADECLDGRVIAGLRSAGHDVLAVRDSGRGSDDDSVLAGARRERRVLVTEDKGFGDLIVHHKLDVPGLVLLRYSQSDVWAVCERLLATVEEHGEGLHEMHVVVTPNRVRVRGLGSRQADRSR